MAGPNSAAWRLGNTAPKRHRSDGEPLATLSYLTDQRFEPQTSRTDSNVLKAELTGRFADCLILYLFKVAILSMQVKLKV